MRKIDWEGLVSEEDADWYRTTGAPGAEDRIRQNRETYGQDYTPPEVPENPAIQSADDPNARAKGTPVDSPGGPQLIDPREQGKVEEVEEDDYDTWSKTDLEKEVDARTKLAEQREDVTPVTVVGTGSGGNITKADLIKGLRVWDQENPEDEQA